MEQAKKFDNLETTYEKKKTNIAEYLKRIQAKIDGKFFDDETHWGHVGSLGAVEEALKEIDGLI